VIKYLYLVIVVLFVGDRERCLSTLFNITQKVKNCHKPIGKRNKLQFSDVIVYNIIV